MIRYHVRNLVAFGCIAVLMVLTALLQGWVGMIDLLTMGVISAIIALGLNMQWGYAGLFNAGVMGFVAIGAFSCVIISMPPVPQAWMATNDDLLLPAGFNVLLAWGIMIGALIIVWRGARLRWVKALLEWQQYALAVVILVAAYIAFRNLFDPAVLAIERTEGEGLHSRYLGGLGLPIYLAWIVGGLLAAFTASLIGRITLGLRADYLAIATLGISEIVIAIFKNEGWLSRGALNVNGIPNAVPASSVFIDMGLARDNAILVSKLLFLAVVVVFLLMALWLCIRALNAPWGRMIRAIRDREDAARAMGKDVVMRHREVFVLGSFLLGLGGAMLATKVGQFAPGEYTPLRYTFLIWVMVIVGGSGNNLGSVVGAMLIWFVWVQAEPVASWMFGMIGDQLGPDRQGTAQLLTERAPQMRTLVMGLVLLLVLRFAPRGLLPETVQRR